MYSGFGFYVFVLSAGFAGVVGRGVEFVDHVPCDDFYVFQVSVSDKMIQFLNHSLIRQHDQLTRSFHLP